MQHLQKTGGGAVPTWSGPSRATATKPTAAVFHLLGRRTLTMRKTMRLFSIALAAAITGGLLLGMAPMASAQGIRSRVVIVGPGPFYGPFYPFFPYYGIYPYPPIYLARNNVDVKLHTPWKDV